MVGQESELVCPVRGGAGVESVCNAQGTQGWAPVHCQQLPGVFSMSVASTHTKPLLLPLPFSALGKSLVWLFSCQGVCAWLCVCCPTVTQPQHCLAPVCTPCCCRVASLRQAQLWWDGMFHSTDLLKMCVLGTGD